MSKFTLVRVLFVIVTGVVLGCSAQLTFAQRGGHGGGGGFHGGGGFRGGGGGFRAGRGFHSVGGAHFGYVGGHSFGGYRGAVYRGGHAGYGWRGGGYRWGGRYWGYSHRRYGWNWGWFFGFGLPNWGWGYPYAYYYSPWDYVTYPYYYEPYCPPGYWCSPNGYDDPPPSNSTPQSGSDPAKPWRPSARTPSTSYPTSDATRGASGTPILSTDRINGYPSSYRVVQTSTTSENPKLRPEVQRAMQVLREMPPFVREREIDTGRYGHFSPEERELFRHLQ